MSRITTKTRTLNSNGEVVDVFASALDGYEITNRDEDISGTAYYGYVDVDGNWYIQKEDNATGDSDFAAGVSDYSTNWSSREGLTYAKFNEVF